MPGGNISFAQILAVEKHADHGRHEKRTGGAVPLDQPQERRGIVGRHKHMRFAENGCGEAKADIGKVKHWRRVEIPNKTIESNASCHAQRACPQILTREHHFLGKAGGAAGIEDAGEVVLAAADILGRRGLRNQFLIAGEAVGRGAVSGVDDMCNAFAGVPHGEAHIEKGVVQNKSRRAGIFDGINMPRDRPTCVHRQDGGPIHATEK